MWEWGWRGKGRAQQRQSRQRNEDVPPHQTITTTWTATTMMMMMMGWLRSRRRRFVFLVLCSPLLLPFLCLAFPLFCVAELCLGFCRRRNRNNKGSNNQYGDDDDGRGLRRCEEGRGRDPNEQEEGRLLQRYLEDQLGLVGSVYDCGDEGFGDDLGEDDDSVDKSSPLLQ